MSNGSVQTHILAGMEEQAPRMAADEGTLSGMQKGKKRQREDKTDGEGPPSKRAKPATGKRAVEVKGLIQACIRTQTHEVGEVAEAPVKQTTGGEAVGGSVRRSNAGTQPPPQETDDVGRVAEAPVKQITGGKAVKGSVRRAIPPPPQEPHEVREVVEAPVKQATEGKAVKVSVRRPVRGNTRTRPPLQETNEVGEVAEASVKPPKWMIPKPVEINVLRSSTALNAGKGSDAKTSRPRIWTGSREELLGMLPDGLNSKFVNGFSWLLYENPVLLLDDTTPFNEVVRDSMDHRVIDLITTRSFLCDDPRTVDAKGKGTAANLSAPSGNIKHGHEVDEAPPTVAVKSQRGPKPKKTMIDPWTSALAPLEQGESIIDFTNHQAPQEAMDLGGLSGENGDATLPKPLEPQLNNVESITKTHPHPPQETRCQGAISQDDKVFGPRTSSSGADSVVTSLRSLPFRELSAPPDNPLSIPIQPAFRVLNSGNFKPDELLETALSILTPQQPGAGFPSVTPGPSSSGPQGQKTSQPVQSHDERSPKTPERETNTSGSIAGPSKFTTSRDCRPDEVPDAALSTSTQQQPGAHSPSLKLGSLSSGPQGRKAFQLVESHDERLPKKPQRRINNPGIVPRHRKFSIRRDHSPNEVLDAIPSISTQQQPGARVPWPRDLGNSPLAKVYDELHAQGRAWSNAQKDISLSSGKVTTVPHPPLELNPSPSSNPSGSISTSRTQKKTRTETPKPAAPNLAQEKGKSLRAAPQVSSSGVPSGSLHAQPSSANSHGKTRNRGLRNGLLESRQTGPAKKGTNTESQASSSTSRPMLPPEGSSFQQRPRDIGFQDSHGRIKEEEGGALRLQSLGKPSHENVVELPAKKGRRPAQQSGEYWDKPCERCARARRKCEKEGSHMDAGSCYHCYKMRVGCEYSQHGRRKAASTRVNRSEDEGDKEDTVRSSQPKPARPIDEDQDSRPPTMNLVETGSQAAENDVSILTQPIDLDSYLPAIIPSELQAIVNAYMCGNPITVWASNKHLSESWALSLPKEFGYVMLGFFRIVGIQEMRCPLVHGPTTQLMNNGMVFGRVRWRFRLRWAPGGEEFIMTKGDQARLEYAWWKPPPPPPSPKSETTGQEQSPSSTTRIEETPSKPRTELKTGDTEGEEPEDDFATTPKYRSARLAHWNYQFRHFHYDDRFTSLVLLHLLAPFGTITPDDSFPRGWFCVECGRLNYQVALRHRWCPSSFCKDSLVVHKPYRVELEFMRDPQDALPVPTPLSTYPPDLTPTTTNWNDEGTQTISCFLQQDESVFIKHVFVRNYPPLQREATRLLAKIQLNVAVSRVVGVNSPYFYYDASSSAEDKDPTNENWKDLPECMNHARHWIVHQARHFGELKSTQLSVNHISILGWVSAGSKKAPGLIRAKDKSVIFWVLGCNVVLTVRPCSRWGIAAKKEEMELDSLIPMENVNGEDPEPSLGSGWVGALQAEEDQNHDSPPEDNPPVAAVGRKPQKVVSKKDTSRNIVLSLVHGDVVVFYGDDFEYSIKRDGTALLVIGSHKA